MLVKLKADWSNWELYKDATSAYLKSKGLGPHIDNRLMGNPPLSGIQDPEMRAALLDYMKNEGLGTVILFESLPSSIYTQLTGQDSLLKKWEALQKLHRVHKSEALQKGADSLLKAVLPGQTPVQYGDGATRSYTEEQSLIIGDLKDLKYNLQKSMLSHLIHFTVLREGLLNRDLVISDYEFLGYIRESFPNTSHYHYYVKAVTARMQGGQGDTSRGGHESGNQRSRVDEVFEMLVEIEKLVKEEAARVAPFNNYY
ncbi:hypothetical protein BJ165DRAFT_1419330 [Panaeolus papilionaceus]|nr:hypothetical protein BJ165DRAFT_1419330 [Panaeolus papilionaceus]